MCRPVQQLRHLASRRELVPKITPEELYEPIFESKKKYPEYECINIRLQGYDFVPLEKYQSYVHRLAVKFKFNVVDSYAVCAQTQRVQTFRPNSSITVSELQLNIYDRWIRLTEVPTPRLSIFLQLLQTHAPIGIQITVKKHEKTDESYRYIPDLVLAAKQEELKALDDPNVRRNLGWE